MYEGEAAFMSLFTSAERGFAEAVADLCYCNPFLPERIELERAALGEAFDESSAVWSRHAHCEHDRPNVARLNERTQQLVAQLRQRLDGGEKPARDEFQVYAELGEYW